MIDQALDLGLLSGAISKVPSGVLWLLVNKGSEGPDYWLLSGDTELEVDIPVAEFAQDGALGCAPSDLFHVNRDGSRRNVTSGAHILARSCECTCSILRDMMDVHTLGSDIIVVQSLVVCIISVLPVIGAGCGQPVMRSEWGA